VDQQGQNGLLTTYREGWRNRSVVGLAMSALLVSFYVVLYWEHKVQEHFGVAPLTALSEAAGLRNRWYLYGFLYSIAMVAGGIYYLKRHGNSRYNRFRITVNVAIQVALGFTLPLLFGGQELYFSYFWPLKYDYLYPQTLVDLPLYFALYTVVGSLLAAPVLAVLYGKRWYCSWVCGCGGLANTFGDPWRHLTSKSTKSWRFEQVSIHVVLFIAIATTVLIGLDWKIGQDHPLWCDSGRGDRDRPLSGVRASRVVPQLLPDGGGAWLGAKAGRLSHQGEARHVHLVRQLQHVLRDGHRCSLVCADRRELHACLMRWVRDVRAHVSARRTQAREPYAKAAVHAVKTSCENNTKRISSRSHARSRTTCAEIRAASRIG